jgi:hypothetical protein
VESAVEVLVKQSSKPIVVAFAIASTVSSERSKRNVIVVRNVAKVEPDRASR